MHTASRVTIRDYTASRVVWLVGLGLGLGLATQASRVNIPRIAIHTATGEASRVYSISHK